MPIYEIIQYIHWGMNKENIIYTMEYYSSTKRIRFLSCVPTCLELKSFKQNNSNIENENISYSHPLMEAKSVDQIEESGIEAFRV